MSGKGHEGKGEQHEVAGTEGPETWSEEYSRFKRHSGGKQTTRRQPPHRRSRSYSPNTANSGFYRNPSPAMFYQSENRPPSRSRRGTHAYSGSRSKGSLHRREGFDETSRHCDTSEGKKSSGYGSYHSKDEFMGKMEYPERFKQHSLDRGLVGKKGKRTKSVEKLRLEKLRHEGVEDSSLTTSTSQCSTENSGNGRSTEADVESSFEDVQALHERHGGTFGRRDHKSHRRERQNRSFDHIREVENHDSIFNRSLPVVLRPEMIDSGTHVCNVSAGSNCSKSDHVLQWLQKNACQGILTAPPPPPVCNAGVASMCVCVNCRPPGNAEEMSNQLLAVLQQGAAASHTAIPLQQAVLCQSATSAHTSIPLQQVVPCQSAASAHTSIPLQQAVPCQSATSAATNQEGQGILALLKPQDMICDSAAACEIQQCPNCVQATCSCIQHPNLNTSGGLLPMPQYHSPQRHLCLQQTVCANTSPLRPVIIQNHPPSICGGGSPCRGAIICGNTLHQAIVQPVVNISSSPLRQSVVEGLSNTVCSSSPLQQTRTSCLDESMLSSISAIQMYQSPTKDDKNNSGSSSENPPPIGVFWDIENCCVPRGKSALNVAQKIRDRFFTGHREAEFMCVCDISKENPLIIQELNDAQVTVAHINATAKNAADDKLRQSLRRFADTHNPPATVVLISGDINFAGNLSDLRHRNGIYVILVHGQEASEALKTCANEAVQYHEIVADLPFRSPAKPAIESNTLVVHNLPPKKDPHHVRNRLRQLSENCGGKVIHNSNNNAIIKFPNAESALRAKKRLEGEKVFGNKISISFPKTKPSVFSNLSGRRGSPQRASSSSPRRRQEEESSKSSADDDTATQDKGQSRFPTKLPPPPLNLPPPPFTTRDQSSSGHYQPSQVLQQAIKQLNQQDFSKPIANLQSPVGTPDPSEGSLGPGVPVGYSQQLGGRVQSPIGTPREQSPIGTPRGASSSTTASNQYFFPATEHSSRPQSRSQSHPQSRTESPLGHEYEADPALANASNRLAAAFRPLNSNVHSVSPEIVIIGDDSRTRPHSSGPHTSGRYSEDDRHSDSEVSMYWRQALKATGLLRAAGDAPRASPPIPANTRSNYQSSGMHSASHFKPIPQVQRLTPPVGGQQTLWNKNETPVESAVLRGHYRVPSPMLARPKGWQYTPYQYQDEQGVELLITNLDHQMDRRDLKRHLVAILSEHCKILHLIFGDQYSGQLQVVVRVASMADAIRVLANVNRRQIGSRLLHVTVLPRSDSNSDKLRMLIIPMLQEIPGMCLPLYKFKAAFETRYQQPLYVADLYQITDTVIIRDSNIGKLVCLTTGSRSSTPTSSGFNSPIGRQSPVPYMPPRDPTPEPCEEFCSIHDTDLEADIDARNTDPLVVVSLRTFSAQVHTLLQLHDGRMPFISFPICYATEFSPLVVNAEQGVPLEHIITCVQGVRVGISRDGFKTVCWSQTRPQENDGAPVSRSGTPLLPTQLFQFSKEAVELLKHSPKCRLAFSKFIPAYHHHFGRQCRVADYGYLKLVELFEAISHVLQILGATEHKLLVLTHRAQVKRFSQDLLKVLKSQASKQVSLEEFPAAYHRTFGRIFDVIDYGVCDVQDLLLEVPEGMLTVSWNGQETSIFIPKREQTSEEQVKMKMFGREVADLLSRQPRYRILFSKFIPAYHHFFGHQCRVAEYGFNKLAELFDALSDVILVEEQGEDRMVTLAGPERVAALARLTSMLLHKNRQQAFPLDALMHNYVRAQGYPVSLHDFGVNKVVDLVTKFPHVVEVKLDHGEQWLHLVEQNHQSQLAQQVLVVLLEAPDGQLSLNNFPASYYQIWQQWLVPTEYGYSKMVLLLKTLHHIVVVHDEWGDICTIQLTPTYQFARHSRSVLLAQHDSLALTMQDFVTRYQRMNKTTLQPSDFGHATLASLVCSVPRVLSLMGKGYRRIVTLNPCCLGPSRPAKPVLPAHSEASENIAPASIPMEAQPPSGYMPPAQPVRAPPGYEQPGSRLQGQGYQPGSEQAPPTVQPGSRRQGYQQPGSEQAPPTVQPGSRRQGYHQPGGGGHQPGGGGPAVQDLLCHGRVPSATESPVLQPDAIPQRYQEDLIDFGNPAVDIPDLLSTSEIEQVTRRFTIPARSSVASQDANTTSASGISIFAEDNSFSSPSSTVRTGAPSRGSISPGTSTYDERGLSESPTSSSCKSPRKTPRKCKLAVNFSIPISK